MKKNGELKIETDIPVPTHRRKASEVREAMRRMNPGDSLLIPGDNRSGISADMIQTWGKGNGTSRKEKGGVRVWRVK